MNSIIEIKLNELSQVSGGGQTDTLKNIGGTVGKFTGHYIGELVDFCVDNVSLSVLTNIAIIGISLYQARLYRRDNLRRDNRPIVVRGNIHTFG